MPRLFGTDGVRGLSPGELTSQIAQVLGKSAVEVLGPRLLIGRDTRASGIELEAGLVAGIQAAGGQALLAGVLPTPAVAWLARELGVDGGIVISASHNPPEYNGIKFFNSKGYKLADPQEDRLEAALQAYIGQEGENAEGDAAGQESEIDDGSEGAAAGQEGAAQQMQTAPPNAASPRPIPPQPIDDAAERYIAYAVQVLQSQGFDLNGLKIVVDCAHGAACQTTPTALRRLGAEVCAINDCYDGSDINVGCGSTDLEQLRAAVLEIKADLGIAHDGDADRVMAVDAQGDVIDGDFIMAICASDLLAQGRLSNDTVVCTVMSNLGFTHAMRDLGVHLEQTEVGDSKVLSRMLEGGFVLGGEQSGHIILSEFNTTGDGLISALQLLAALRRSGRSLTQLATLMHKYPQVLANVPVADPQAVQASKRLAAVAQAARDELGDQGRVVLRASGTEPLYRVMVEAESFERAESIADRLVAAVTDIATEIKLGQA